MAFNYGLCSFTLTLPGIIQVFFNTRTRLVEQGGIQLVKNKLNNKKLGAGKLNNFFTIDCGEILLREFSIEDVDDIYSITSQPEVNEFLPDWKSTREQRLNWVTNYEIPSNKKFFSAVPNIDSQNYLKLGIVLKETGEFIGFCNTGIKEELPSPNREIVYAISKYYRNKGYTTKAVEGLINYLFLNTNVDLINAVVLPHNVSSDKVIQKCGFSFRAEIEIENQQHYHYTLGIEEWRSEKLT